MLDRSFASTQTLQIAELHTLDIFYTPLEARFDRITRLARQAMRVQAAAITLLDRERQWFKSIEGWEVRELPRAKSLCLSTIDKGEPVIIEDLLKEPEYSQHPLVTSGPKFRFYAGFPLFDAAGTALGTFCVYDTKPRSISPGLVQSLRDAGESAQKELLTNELRDAQQKLVTKLGTARRQATLDELPRVWNRRGGIELLGEMLALSESERRGLAVCMIDLDRFKAINDDLGHQAGDQVLRKVTGLIIGCLRSDDVICRFGGDEFLLVLNDIRREELEAICERIRERVREFPIKTRKGPAKMTVTIGAALRQPEQKHLGRETFIEVADSTLIQAKRAGRDSVRIIDCGDELPIGNSADGHELAEEEASAN